MPCNKVRVGTSERKSGQCRKAELVKSIFVKKFNQRYEISVCLLDIYTTMLNKRGKYIQNIE